MTAVFNATRPDEHVVAATVATIADRVDAQEVVGPCVVLIGEVLRAGRPCRCASVPGRVTGQALPLLSAQP